MTPDWLHFVLLALMAGAIMVAIWSRKAGSPDAVRLDADLKNEREERARDRAAADSALNVMRGERDEARTRLQESERAKSEALAAAAAAKATIDGAELALAVERRGREDIRIENSALQEKARLLTAELAAFRERSQAADQTFDKMKEAFASQSQDVMRAALEDIRKREDEGRQQREAMERQKLDAQLKPMAETLQRFEQNVAAAEKRQAEDVGGLKAQIEGLLVASQATQAEARKLSSALRRGAGVQGRWGEQTLRNVLETAGLAARFDFDEQVEIETEDGRFRPDVVVKMPGGGVFVVDAKCSLTAFLESQDALEDGAREAALMRHAESIKAHIAGLSAKSYWEKFKETRSPDFVAMFVPGDTFLAAALDRYPTLMTDAMERRVLLVTPTTLFGLCKAVAYGWRVEEQTRNAQEIALLGKDLYKRLSVMGGHMGEMGASLGKAIGKYNSLVGSYESQVLSKARQFEALKVDHEGKDLAELPPIETGVRPLARLTADDASEPPAQDLLSNVEAVGGGAEPSRKKAKG